MGENEYLDHEMFPKNGKQERINHVITNMTTNHDPNGIVSLHKNGAPVQVNMSLTFQETEFIVSQDEVDENFETTNRNLARQVQDANEIPSFREDGLTAPTFESKIIFNGKLFQKHSKCSV